MRLVGLSFALLWLGCGEDSEIALDGATGGTGGSIGGCKSSDECGDDDRFCALDLGRCVRCLSNEHCDGEQRCSSDHECRRACDTDDDCGDDYCDLAEHVCVECRNDEDCTTGEYPRCSATHECRQCLSNEHCEPPKVCDPVEFQCRD